MRLFVNRCFSSHFSQDSCEKCGLRRSTKGAWSYQPRPSAWVAVTGSSVRAEGPIDRLAGPMEKAPYPPCHAKPVNAFDWDLRTQDSDCDMLENESGLQPWKRDADPPTQADGLAGITPHRWCSRLTAEIAVRIAGLEGAPKVRGHISPGHRPGLR